LTGKRRNIAVATALCTGLGLTAVPLASAYTVPGPPGTPGGQPIDPTGGSGASQAATLTAATALAGYTPSELSKLSPKVTLPPPADAPKLATLGIGADSAAKTGSYAKVSCSVDVRKSELGSGSARNGAKSFRIRFTKHGRQYLRTHNGDKVSLGVKCVFVPKHGKKSTSTSKVVLAK
jgi:hypothetical protein